MRILNILFVSRSTILEIKGGDTVQMLNTAKALKDFGVNITFYEGQKQFDFSKFDLIHFFNLTRPVEILKILSLTDIPFVVSTIYIDYSFYKNLKKPVIHKWISTVFGAHGMEYFKIVGKFLLGKEKLEHLPYLWNGQQKSIKSILSKSKLLLPNSKSEIERLEKDLQIKTDFHIVCNGIDESLLNFKIDTKRIKKQILCVGSIEPRKNQLNLIKAVNQTDFTLIIAGKTSPNHQNYFEACKNEAKSNIQFTGRISQKKLNTLFLESEIHCLPSLFETCGLVSLEAGVLGCKVITSKTGDQEDYMQGMVNYIDPYDIESIKAGLVKSSQEPYSNTFRDYILTHYTWNKAAEQTFNAYKSVLEWEN